MAFWGFTPEPRSTELNSAMNKRAGFELVVGAVISAAACLNLAAGQAAATRDKATTGSERPEPTYPNCTRIFNGVNFEGWEALPGSPTRRQTMAASASSSPRG